MLEIVLLGEPVAQARMRLFKRGHRVMVYDPQSALKRDLKRQVEDQVDID